MVCRASGNDHLFGVVRQPGEIALQFDLGLLLCKQSPMLGATSIGGPAGSMPKLLLAIQNDSYYKCSLSFSRTSKYVLGFAVAGVYGWIALRGPLGIQSLLDKRQEIRSLQEQNTNMAREIERRKDRIRRLSDSPSEQEMEIRKQLKLLKPGETTFILQDAQPADTAKP